MIEKYSHPKMAQVWSQDSKVAKWLAVEIAACGAWAKQGLIPAEAMDKIRGARYDLRRMAEIEAETHHDVTAFLGSVSESLGEESRFVHMGLTSSDVLDTGMALQVRDAVAILRDDALELLKVLRELTLKHKRTIMVGRTHGVHAEPTTFGFKVALWLDEMRRNLDRLENAAQEMAVGKISGAVGTHATVPPIIEEEVCLSLGLRPAPVSSQIVQRDRHAFFMMTLAVMAASLEKMATEIRSLQRTEIREVEEPFEKGQTGSSAMPHKRNPILCERICGLARVIRGHATTAIENVSLWHERDISHSSTERIIFPESCGLLDYMLRLTTHVLSNLRVYPERMRANLDLTRGLVFSQRVLLALINKGVSRKEAYGVVQRSAMRVWEEDRLFMDLLEQEPLVNRHFTQQELRGLFDYQYFLQNIDVAFERLGL
ncbi:MAG: adenylosuccinate lyase [Chloroflexi bacterium]|nr:adenylosuccinate lyase [Chloroflexota bacterium]